MSSTPHEDRSAAPSTTEPKPPVTGGDRGELPAVGYGAQEGSASAGKGRRRRMVILGGLVAVVVLALALGLGIGLGTKHSSTSSSSSSSGGTSGNDTSTTSLSPGNSSSITTTIPLSSLLGDQSRYLLSSRNFTITNTPTTRVYNWTISEVWSTPGGLTKPMIVVNGMSPGPVLEANLGDQVIVNVYNNMTNETAVHWHGQYQRGTNFMDGTYGITQCGIPPGETFVYNFTAQTVGTSWWHAHRLAQYTDGLFGPIVFHAANETAMTANKYDDDYTFVLNDMYNTQASALEWRFRAVGTGIDGQPGDEPTPDGGMINGVSQARCAYIPPTDLVIAERKRSLDGQPIAGSLTKRGSSGLRQRSTTAGTYYPETNYCGNATTTYWNATWVAGKTYRIRLVNAGTFVNTEFSIDNHTLTVIEADGVSVEPLNVSSINLAIAQRYSVLVTLDQPAGAYWIRNVLATDQVRYTGLDFNDTTLGVLRYEGVSETILPANLPASSIGNLTAFDTTSLVPAEKQDAQLPTQSAWVQFDMQYTSDNQHYMFVNSSSWSPLGLGQASVFDVTASTTSANQSLGDQLSVVNSQAGVFDLVVNSLDDGDHPFHLHGHTFQIMSQGDGRWTGDTATLNTTNPMRRDTIVIPSYGHLVLRFVTDNPGVWAFHCHITWHMEIGLLMTITDLPDQIAQFNYPSFMKEQCSRDTSLGFRRRSLTIDA